ncbi:MAG: hypothetical protein AB1736_15300 [Chloroflexota bacterium]
MTAPGIVVREIAPAEMARLGEITVAAYREVGGTDEPYYAQLSDVATRAAVVPVLVAVQAGTGRLFGGLTYVPRSIRIYTRPFMTAARGLYESLGFERLPDLDWQLAPGERLLAYRLAL